MHIADFAVGMLGANGIVGGGLPIASGAALAAQLEGKGDVAVCFFGDGAAAEGEFHEALNIALGVEAADRVRLREQPVRGEQRGRRPAPARRRRGARRRRTACPASSSTATTCWRSTRATGEAVDRARRGDGPTPARVQDVPLALPRDARRAAAGDAAGRRDRRVEGARPDRAARDASRCSTERSVCVSESDLGGDPRRERRARSRRTRWRSPTRARFPIRRTCSVDMFAD